MKYEFHPEALDEYKEAAIYYAKHQHGLELRFIVAIENSIKQIIASPTRCKIMEYGIRRCITKVFPYAVLYTIEIDHILIIAITHTHREPGYWHHRIVQ